LIVHVVERGRLLFRLRDTAGQLSGNRTLACAFASGESLSPQTEEKIFQCAEKAKDWDGFVFKLKLEGFDIREGETLKLPFGKL